MLLKASPPNASIAGPVPASPGFPLKTCGNDGHEKPIPFFKKKGEILPGSRRFKRRRHLLMPAGLFEFFFVIETERLEHRQILNREQHGIRARR